MCGGSGFGGMGDACWRGRTAARARRWRRCGMHWRHATSRLLRGNMVRLVALAARRRRPPEVGVRRSLSWMTSSDWEGDGRGSSRLACPSARGRLPSGRRLSGVALWGRGWRGYSLNERLWRFARLLCRWGIRCGLETLLRSSRLDVCVCVFPEYMRISLPPHSPYTMQRHAGTAGRTTPSWGTTRRSSRAGSTASRLDVGGCATVSSEALECTGREGRNTQQRSKSNY